MKTFLISAFADEIDMDLDIQIQSLKELDIHYIEMRGVNGKNIVDVTLEEAKIIKTQLDREHIQVSAIGSPIGKVSILDDFEIEMDRFKHILEISKILNVKYIRMFSFFIPKGENPEIYFEEVMDRWQRYIEAAKTYQVILLHENEKEIYGDTADRCKKLMDSLQSDQVRLTFDPANFVQVGGNVLEAYEKLKEYITYIHIKDADENNQNVPPGKGIGELDKLLEKLKHKGYTGFLSLEPHLSSFDGRELLEKEGQQNKLKIDNRYDLFKIAYKALKDILRTLEGNRIN